NALNHDWLLPQDVAISNANTPDPDEKSKQKVDAGLYRRDDADKVEKHTKWAYMELSIECKTQAVQHDPFDESSASGNHEDASDVRQKFLGQIMSYSMLIFDHQQRVHHLMLLIFDEKARIIRWDRSGLVATKPFNYVQEPELLGRFIWRFARMSPEQRGHDPTATRISTTSAGYHMMTKHEIIVPGVVGDHARAAFAKSLRGNSICWRLRADDAQKGTHYLLVGKPHFIAPGLAGRGTKTFVAVDEADPQGPFVYLKDAWRVAHTGIKQEGEILKKLNSDGDDGPVPYVPTLRYHGDVESQETRSQEIWKKQHKDEVEKDCPLKKHRHYRLVVNEVGISLDKFESACELIGVIIDCIQAHGHAYKRKNLIHRDISAGNVLIYPKVTQYEHGNVVVERVGLLADWELAESVGEKEEGPRQPDRTGTWQFMSANALRHPSKKIIVQDDMESLFHLLLYQAIRYLPHICFEVGRFVEKYFDGYEERRGAYYGGEKKMETMKSGALTTTLTEPLRFYLSEPGPPEEPRTETCGPTTSPSSGSESPKSKKPNPGLHPINAVFNDMLQVLQAHYLLYLPNESTVASGAAQERKVFPLAPRRASVLKAFGWDKNKARASDISNPLRPTSPANRTRLEALATKLASHEALSHLMTNRYVNEDWPAEDRVPDKLPGSYGTKTGRKRFAESTWVSSQSKTKCSWRPSGKPPV
ncbi:hypothetical protein C8Q70DRAFT_905386, partial [Cubamyces menziesii]